MCILFWTVQPPESPYLFVFAGNRDEFFSRPTQSAHWWPSTAILAGKDLKGGGTWLGISKRGRFCALTNFREPQEKLALSQNLQFSRGRLVIDCIDGAIADIERYPGFNLISVDLGKIMASDTSNYEYISNRSPVPCQKLVSGEVYGVSNGCLVEGKSAWPKVKNGLEIFRDTLTASNEDELVDNLFELMENTDTCPEEHLPETGVGAAVERKLCSIFVKPFSHGDIMPEAVEEHHRDVLYGTRSTTLIVVRKDGHVRFIEKNHIEPGHVEHIFKIEPDDGGMVLVE